MSDGPARVAPPAAFAHWRGRFAVSASVEELVLAASLYFTFAANGPFLGAALRSREIADPQTWLFAGMLLIVVAAVHFVIIGALATRRTVKPLLVALLFASAVASHHIQSLRVVLDPAMMRSVLRTDYAEARELLSASLALHLVLYAGLPSLLLLGVRVTRRPPMRAVAVRVLALALAVLAAGAAVLAVSRPFASFWREHREARYLITPANVLYSTARVVAADVRSAAGPRAPIGEDAVAGPLARSRTKPFVVVLVVGETVRAANWGLDGYARDTTPELARRGVLNFEQTTSCGTSTEVSLPCMFAPVGRRDYDEARIRGSQSLLHVLARAGVAVPWRDNQSGCKGVCDGLPADRVIDRAPPGLCAEGRCLDDGLIDDLDERLDAARGPTLMVLHQLGNHGPSYFRRYPAAFERFRPACRRDDLAFCTREEITNAFDNAILYTDSQLARIVDALAARADRIDSALIYLSDHGESLGENGLYLHGMPWSMAPQTQTRVPMVAWLSEGTKRGLVVDQACLEARARQPASHDHLFHTLLGLFDVRTSLYEGSWDLLSSCRAEPS